MKMRLRAGSSGLFAGRGVNRTTIPAAEVVQFGWAFRQKSFNPRSPLGNVVVHALNVGGVDPPARVELKCEPHIIKGRPFPELLRQLNGHRAIPRCSSQRLY